MTAISGMNQYHTRDGMDAIHTREGITLHLLRHRGVVVKVTLFPMRLLCVLHVSSCM